MSAISHIEHHSKHGVYWCTPAALDNAIATFLPASANSLRDLVAEISPEVDWSDLTVSEALVVLASFHGA